jgi:hypothetical protein
MVLWAELDLTPRAHSSELEGTRAQVTAFSSGPNLVTWQPPHSWRISGEPTRVSLIPANAAQADATIEMFELPVSGTLDATLARKLKEDIARALPREASAIEWANDELNPIELNRHPTYRIRGSYTLFAQRYTTTVLVCNFAEHQLRFRLTARAANFPKLHKQFHESLYTWQGLK